MTQDFPLSPMEVNGGADIHVAACGEAHAGVCGYTLKEAAALVVLEQVSWQDLQPTLEMSVPERGTSQRGPMLDYGLFPKGGYHHCAEKRAQRRSVMN